MEQYFAQIHSKMVCALSEECVIQGEEEKGFILETFDYFSALRKWHIWTLYISHSYLYGD